MNTKKGITLISIAITIVILLILTAITVLISVNNDFLSLSKETREELARTELNEYARAVKASIITDKTINRDNMIDKFVAQIIIDNNLDKEDFEKVEVTLINKVDVKVTIKRQNVEAIIDFEDLEKVLAGSSDISLNNLSNRFTITFDYMDGDEEKSLSFIVDESKSLSQYFSETGHSIPTGKMWMPDLDLNVPVTSNTHYLEVK